MRGQIRLDVAARRIDLLVDDAELERRRAALPTEAKPDWARRGYARLFHDSLMQAAECRSGAGPFGSISRSELGKRFQLFQAGQCLGCCDHPPAILEEQLRPQTKAAIDTHDIVGVDGDRERSADHRDG